MKKNKIVVLAGMALLAVGTILNVHDAFNEFGVMEISLHPRVMAQMGGVNGTETGFGEQLDTEVYCKKISNGSDNSSSSSGSTTESYWDAGVSGGNGVIGGSLDGGQTIGSSTSSETSTNNSETVIQEFKAKKYYCGLFEYVKICSITNPCNQ